MVLVDLPTIDERDIPVLMASFIGQEETGPGTGTKYFALDMVGYDESIGLSKEYPLHRLHVIFHTETEAEVMRWSPLIMFADENWIMRKIFRHESKVNTAGKGQRNTGNQDDISGENPEQTGGRR